MKIVGDINPLRYQTRIDVPKPIFTLYLQTEEEEEELTYFAPLRSQKSIQELRERHRLTSMIVWSYDVHRVEMMWEHPERKLTRAVTEKQIRKKTPIPRFLSVPIGTVSSGSNISI